ncbi:MAG: hypothetical protein L3J57_01620 [Desulfuromusa sp.]|nr:hypothetical protein [Desulfuromusa sp.]
MRCENWPTVLNDLLEQRRSTPFQWGENDCALFTADVVEALTGVDYAADFRGRYSSVIGSVRSLAKAGHSNIEQAITAVLGEPVEPPFIKRGDVCLFAGGEGMTVGICVGVMIVSPAAAGLQWSPMSLAVRGWNL